MQSFSEERREEKTLKKIIFEIHSNGPNLFLLSLPLQLCTDHWRASPVTIMFISGMQEARGGGQIYTSLSCPCATSIILFSLRLDGTCPLFTWKLLLQITPFCLCFCSKSDLHLMNSETSKVHCLINEQCSKNNLKKKKVILKQTTAGTWLRGEWDWEGSESKGQTRPFIDEFQ